MFKVYMLILFLNHGQIVGHIDGGPGPSVIACQQAIPMVLEAKKEQIPADAIPYPVCIDVSRIGEGERI